MAEMNKINSFKSFTEIKAQGSALKLREENQTKRQELASNFTSILDEMGITSLAELDEETQKTFISKVLGKEVNEGNTFVYAAGKTKAEGKDEFEFNGKTYKVTIKDTGIKESVEITDSLLTERELNSKVAKKLTIGDTIRTNKHAYTITDFGQKSNAFRQFQVEDEAGEIYQIEVSLYGSNKIRVGAGRSLNFRDEVLESLVNESKMSEIDQMAQDSKDFKSFVKEFTKTHHDLSNAGEPNQFTGWLQSIYDTAKENTDESVTESKDDFMAKYGSANINLKKGYKHHTAEELNDLYDKLGDLVKTLKVKDVTLVFESEITEGSKEDALYMKQQLAKLKDARDNAKSKKRLLALQQKQNQARIKKANEAEVNEAEIKSDDEFKEYAFTVLKKAFESDFDEAKAGDVVDGILKKCDGDYGAAVGMLTSSLA